MSNEKYDAYQCDYWYNKVFSQIANLQHCFSVDAKLQMAKIVDAIAKSNTHINSILANEQTIAVKSGYIAEEFHVETFNLDAISNGDECRSYTDNYTEWYKHDANGEQLSKFDVSDIIIGKNNKVMKDYQVKYLKTGQQTAGALSDPKYNNCSDLLAPSDQIAEIKQVAINNINKNIQRNGNELQRQMYHNVANKVTDRIQNGESISSTLSKKEAMEIASGDKERLKQIECEYQTKSTIQHMKKAAAGAAAISAIVCGTTNILRYIQMARSGKLSVQDAAYRIIAETASSAADSAIKAAANANVMSVMVRYGSKKAALQILSRQGIQSMLKTNVVIVGVTCAVDAIKDLVLLGVGTITKDQFHERQGKGILMTSAGAIGAGFGATSAGMLPFAGASMLGGIAGSLIAGLAMNMAIQNGIERPYKALLQNTQNLQEASIVFEHVSRNIFQGQALFSKFIDDFNNLNDTFNACLKDIDKTGVSLLKAINKI